MTRDGWSRCVECGAAPFAIGRCPGTGGAHIHELGFGQLAVGPHVVADPWTPCRRRFPRLRRALRLALCVLALVLASLLAFAPGCGGRPLPAADNGDTAVVPDAGEAIPACDFDAGAFVQRCSPSSRCATCSARDGAAFSGCWTPAGELCVDACSRCSP